MSLGEISFVVAVVMFASLGREVRKHERSAAAWRQRVQSDAEQAQASWDAALSRTAAPADPELEALMRDASAAVDSSRQTHAEIAHRELAGASR